MNSYRRRPYPLEIPRRQGRPSSLSSLAVPRSKVTAVVVAFCGILIILVLVSLFPTTEGLSSSSSGKEAMPQQVWRDQKETSPVFTLLVTLEFSAIEHKNVFLHEYFPPVAKHVRDHEPDTLAYEVLLSDKDPLQVMILERYRDKENAYLQVHKSSQPFLEFRPKLKNMQDQSYVTVSGHSYFDSEVGFGGRVSMV